MNFLKTIILAWSLASASLRADVLDQRMDLNDADYRAVRGLQFVLAGEPGLPAGGSSRAEMVLALAELSQAASNGGVETILWKEQDYETLHNLLEKYRLDLGALGQRQDALDKYLSELDARLPPLEKRMKVLPAAGFRISGYFTTVFDDISVYGPGIGPGFNGYATMTGYQDFFGTKYVAAGTPVRYRHAISRLGMIFSGNYGLFSSALEYDLQVTLGDFDTYPGLRWFKGELRTPLALQFGNLDVQMTPLTFWRNEDDQPFEPEPYASRRQRLRDEAMEKDNAWPMKGVRLMTDVVLFDAQRLTLEGFTTIMDYQGSILYTDPPGRTKYTVLNDTYLAVWKVGLPVRIAGEPVFDAGLGQATGSLVDLDLGYVGTRIWDLPSGIPYGNGPLAITTSARPSAVALGFDSQVHSVQADLSFFGKLLSFKGEMAQSLYSNPFLFADDPKVGLTGYLTATASTYSAELDVHWMDLKVWGVQTGADFVSAPAQGRSTAVEYSGYGPFPTEDIQYNPRSGLYDQFISYGSIVLFDTFPASRYLNYFLPPQYTQGNVVFADKRGHEQSMFNYLQTYDPGLNNSLPYGLATPNREGYGWSAGLNLFKGGIRPLAYGSLLHQTQGDQYVAVAGLTSSGAVTQPPLAPNVYNMMAVGLHLDMQPMFGLPVNLVGGYKVEDTSNGDWVAFTSTLLDSGMEFKFYEKTTFALGYRHLDYNGTLFKQFFGGRSVNLPPGQSPMLIEVDTWGAGMVYRFTPRVTLMLNYTAEIVQNSYFPNKTLENDEAFAKFLVKY